VKTLDTAAKHGADDVRRQMAQSQLVRRGIQNQRVLDAMTRVPREEFVSDGWRDAAYADGALPIDCGQTISQPFTVAFMCEAAEISRDDTVLEVGTGSGYGAAVLSLLAREVHSVERIPVLGQQAAERLRRLGHSNVHVHTANGTLGWLDAAPFDAIVVTAGAEALPKPYVEQLQDGGRIIIPLGRMPHSQTMYRFTLKDGKLYVENLGGFTFVPLIGKYATFSG
jgi:protein-L-isoaspartate(D-aspartate) O-methyltransferase